MGSAYSLRTWRKRVSASTDPSAFMSKTYFYRTGQDSHRAVIFERNQHRRSELARFDLPDTRLAEKIGEPFNKRHRDLCAAFTGDLPRTRPHLAVRLIRYLYSISKA